MKHQLNKFNSAKRCEILPDSTRTAIIRGSGKLNRGWKDWSMGKQSLSNPGKGNHNFGNLAWKFLILLMYCSVITILKDYETCCQLNLKLW